MFGGWDGERPQRGERKMIERGVMLVVERLAIRSSPWHLRNIPDEFVTWRGGSRRRMEGLCRSGTGRVTRPDMGDPVLERREARGGRDASPVPSS